jgi:rhodanese-related sulfurtransferase
MDDLPNAITVQELDEWRRTGRAVTLLDVREPWELAICRFSDALAIPLQSLPARLDEIPTDRTLVVLCHHGMRSAQAVGWLRRNLVPNAVNLTGGIDAWAREIEPDMGIY